MKPRAPRPVQLILLSFVFAVGAFIFGYGCYATVMGWSSQSWPSVKGEIAWLDQKTWGYDYEIEGTRFHGSKEDFKGNKPRKISERLKRLRDLYPDHKIVNVYYCPAKPSLAVIRPGLGNRLWLFFFGGFVFCSIAGLQIWYLTNKRSNEM